MQRLSFPVGLISLCKMPSRPLDVCWVVLQPWLVFSQSHQPQGEAWCAAEMQASDHLGRGVFREKELRAVKGTPAAPQWFPEASSPGQGQCTSLTADGERRAKLQGEFSNGDELWEGQAELMGLLWHRVWGILYGKHWARALLATLGPGLEAHTSLGKSFLSFF